jgi:hypothetical protein
LALGLQYPALCSALAPEYQAAVNAKALEMFYQNPKYTYVLGGDPDDLKVDCSGFVLEVYRKSGCPVTEKKTQAWRIYRGHDGFVGDAIMDTSDSEPGDVLCLAVPGSLQRPYGINHVGMIVEWQGLHAVIDASSKAKGIRISPFGGIWKKDLPVDGHRRIKFGGK